MNSRFFIWGFLLLMLGGVAFFTVRNSGNRADKTFNRMVVSSPDVIGRIEIAGTTDTLVILKSGNVWMTGEGEVLMQKAVENLLYAASNMMVSSIFSSGIPDGEEEAVLLNFFSGRKRSSSFHFVAREGRYFLWQPGEKPAYQIEIPGLEEVALEKIFSTNPDMYRDHLMINLLPREIARLEIRPFQGSDFSVQQDTLARISVTGSGGEELAVNDRKIRLLLSYFTAIRFDEVIRSDDRRDILSPRGPSAEILLTEFGGNQYHLQIYPWMQEGEESADLFRAVVILNGSANHLLVNYKYLDLPARGLESYLMNR